MSFSTFLNDRQAVANFGDWLVEFYVTDPTGTPVTLRVSRRGTVTGLTAIVTSDGDTIPASTLYYKRLLVAPTLTQSLWRSGQIGGSSFPAFGSFVVNNADGGWDEYSPANGYVWADARCKVFFCDTRAGRISSTVGKVFDGRIGYPKFSLAAVEVPLLGREADFNQPTSSRVYRGTGYMLEMIAARQVSYGTPAALNITGSFTLETWIWAESLTAAPVEVWGWLGATLAPWRVIFNAGGAITVGRHIGGVNEDVASTLALSIRKPYHLAIVVSGRDCTFYLWDDDAQTLTTEPHVNGFSSATANARSGGTYILNEPSQTWWDEMRVWNVARTPAELAANRHGEIPSGAIPASCVHCTRMNDGVGTSVVDSSATAANGTISGAGTSTWLWSMEGDGALAGTPKPDQWGQKYNMACVLVDPVRSVYQIAGAGAMNAISQTKEGGANHTMSASAASLRALMTTTPAAGNSLPYPARGLFRLGASPTLPISADGQGYTATPGYGNTAADIITSIVRQRGPVLGAGDLDTASFTALENDDDSVCGVHLLQPQPINTLLDFVSGSVGAWWGYVRAAVLLHVARFEGPIGATVQYEFTARDIVEIDDAMSQIVVYEVRVKFRHNEVVMSEDQVAASVKGTTGWQVLTQEWQEEVASDPVLRAKYPGAASRSITIETALQERADARTFAAFVLDLLGGARRTPVVTVMQKGYQVKASETCTIEFVTQAGQQRLEYDGIEKFSILTVHDRQQDGTVKLELLGEKV